MPLTASVVIAGASALGKVGTGIGQLISGGKKSRNNIRPLFDIQEEYFDNRDIAASMAQGGLTDSAMDYYSDMAGRGLQTTTSAILQGGGGTNAVTQAYDRYSQGIRSVAAEDSILQTKNILSFLDRNDTLAKQKVQKWVIDKYEPYKDTAAAATKEKTAGLNNLFTGLSEGTGALAAYSQADNYEDMLDRVGQNGGNVTVTPPSANTTYYTPKPSGLYGDFVDPYAVTPIQKRAEQVRAEVDVAGLDMSQMDADLQEYYRRLYKDN